MKTKIFIFLLCAPGSGSVITAQDDPGTAGDEKTIRHIRRCQGEKGVERYLATTKCTDYINA